VAFLADLAGPGVGEDVEVVDDEKDKLLRTEAELGPAAVVDALGAEGSLDEVGTGKLEVVGDVKEPLAVGKPGAQHC